jgi:hypothetical protein
MAIANPFDTFLAMRKQSQSESMTQPQIDEILSRTNLNNAQASHIQPQKSPVDEINYLQGIMQQYPRGTPQNMWASRALGEMVLQGSPESSTGSGRGTSKSGSNLSSGFTIDGQTGELIPNVASQYRGPKQYSQQNPDGSSTIYMPPSSATQSQVEKRMMAHEEVASLYDVWQKGTRPYVGAQGGLRLLADRVKAFMGNADEQTLQRLADYAQAEKIRPELAKNIDRFSSGGETSVEGTKAIADSALGKNWLMPSSVVQQAMDDYLGIQGKAFNKSIEPNAMNFPYKLDKAPAYVNPGFNQPPMDWYQIAADYQKSQQPKTKQSRRPNYPEFKNKSAFQSWYLKQTPEVQQQVRQQLGAKQ